MSEEKANLSCENIFSHPDPMECACLYWADVWDKEELLRGNKHHKRCRHRKDIIAD